MHTLSTVADRGSLLDQFSATRLGRLRIVHVVTRSDTVAGVQRHILDIAKSLQDLGHEVFVLFGGEGPFADVLTEWGIPHRPLTFLTRPIRPHLDLLAVYEMARILRVYGPDLVCAHSSKAGIISRITGRLTGIPVVFTVHGWAFTEGIPRSQRMLYRCVERLAGHLAGRIICVSEHSRQLALTSRICDPDKLCVIRNGLGAVPNHLKGDPGASPVNMIMAARFEKPKDHRMILKALTAVRGNWRMHFVGDGPERHRIERLAAQLGLDGRLRFWGVRDDVPEILKDMQVAVLISNWEALPYSIIEAMRAGLPVVASEVGGVDEAVKDGTTGFLVPRGAEDTLRERLQRLVEDPALRVGMGAAGGKRYQSYFTLDRMLEKTLETYASALNGSNGANR